MLESAPVPRLVRCGGRQRRKLTHISKPTTQGVQEGRYDSLEGFRVDLGRLCALHCQPACAAKLLGRAERAIAVAEEVGGCVAVHVYMYMCMYCCLFIVLNWGGRGGGWACCVWVYVYVYVLLLFVVAYFGGRGEVSD